MTAPEWEGPPDVVTLSDVAAMYGVTRQRVAVLLDPRVNAEVPPGTRTSAGMVYDRADVIAYAVWLGRKVTW